MKTLGENDIVRLREPLEAQVIGERRSLVAPKDAIGTVVLVHGDLTKPLAYEVEIFIPAHDCYVLVTVDPSLIVAA